jgi:hypothetical protein
MSFNRAGVASTYAFHSEATAPFDLDTKADDLVIAVEALDLGGIILDWLCTEKVVGSSRLLVLS